jgi:aryl-alcohol dehydrogenase-like predicted oxidoreductase
LNPLTASLLNTSRLGLGTVQFGLPYGIANKTGQPDKSTVKSVLQVALENDISVLDTASAYGTAELVLGELGIEGFRVVSKYTPPESNISIEEQLHTTLRVLQHHKLYGYLSHRPQNLLKHPEQWDVLNEQKSQGFIDKIGYSLNEPSELESLLDAGMIPDLVQVPVNYLDQRFVPYFDQLKAYGTEIHARSAYLQGLFFLRDIPERFVAVAEIIRDLQQSVKNLPAALLAHVLLHAHIDRVIIGVQHQSQLLDVISGLGDAERLTPTDLNISDDILMPSKWSS